MQHVNLDTAAYLQLSSKYSPESSIKPKQMLSQEMLTIVVEETAIWEMCG